MNGRVRSGWRTNALCRYVSDRVLGQAWWFWPCYATAMPKWLVGRPPAEMEELALLCKNLLRVYAPQISQGPPAKIRCLQQLVTVSCRSNLLWVSGVRKRVLFV